MQLLCVPNRSNRRNLQAGQKLSTTPIWYRFALHYWLQSESISQPPERSPHDISPIGCIDQSHLCTVRLGRVVEENAQRTVILHTFSTRIQIVVGGKIITMGQAEWWVGPDSGALVRHLSYPSLTEEDMAPYAEAQRAHLPSSCAVMLFDECVLASRRHPALSVQS